MFYTRRFFRIAPIYYLALLVAFVFQSFYQDMEHQIEFETHLPVAELIKSSLEAPFDTISLLLHASFLFGLMPSQGNNNILPDWSIGLEMQFYCVFPFLMLLLRRIGALWFASGALALGRLDSENLS